MSGPHALVVGSAPVIGHEAHYSRLITGAGLLIAADGGVALCLSTGRVPDVVVGDFDSVDPDVLAEAQSRGARIERFPAQKDESDLDLAVLVARGLGADRLTLTAAFTDRIDHTLAGLGTLARSADLHGCVSEPGWQAYALDEQMRADITLHEPQGTTLSLMAATGSATVSIHGVRYPLDAAALAPLSSLGLSNVATAPTQEVSVHHGSVLVLVNEISSDLTLS